MTARPLPPAHPPERGPPRLSRLPDLGSLRGRLLTSLVVSLIVAAVLIVRFPVAANHGDTDDALRLVMVRDLLAGQGWYDQVITRLGPPHGLQMHWSRLLDGGLAGAMALARLVARPATAEWLARVVWPLAWIMPAAAAALTVARNLGGRLAVFLTAVLLLINLTLYMQFIPGRIDHHNLQIVMVIIALAGATTRSHQVWWAAIAGAAGGLGLAIGLEALALQALIGAAFAARLLADRRQGPAAVGYGLALTMSCLAAFLIQTPPERWRVSVCDALAWNSTLAVMAAGLGMAVLGALAKRASFAMRLGALALTAGAALGAYVALHPACLHGPFAEVSPLARRLWLDHVEEAQPLNIALLINREGAISFIVFLILALASAIFLVARQGRSPAASVWVAAAVVVAASAMAVWMWKMAAYAEWVAVPVMGAAYGVVAERRLRSLLLPSVLGAMLLSPTVIGAAANAAENAVSPPRGQAASQAPREACFAPGAYAALAALPPGRVLSEIDLGSFILLFTPHAALTAPYHRMWPAILKAEAALEGPPERAEARVRSLGADYVADCPGLSLMTSNPGLAARLREGRTPSWLREVSMPGATLRIYRVLPAEGSPRGPEG